MPRAWLAVAALVVAGLCWNTGGHALLDPSESRVALAARAAAQGDGAVPPSVAGLPDPGQPPVGAASVGLAFRLLGETERVARLPSLLFTLATALLVWRLGHRMGPPGTGGIAAVAFGTMPLAAAAGRFAGPEAAHTFLVTLALYFAWRGLSGERGRRAWAAAAWAVSGAAALAASPLAALTAPLVVAAFGAAARRPLGPFLSARAWPWVLALPLPWLIAVTLRRPDFPYFVAFEGGLGAALPSPAGSGNALAVAALVLVAGGFPWTGPAAAGAVEAFRSRARRTEPQASSPVFIASWTLVPCAVAVVLPGGGAGRLLPVLPGVALAAGLVLAHALRDHRARGPAGRGVEVAAVVLGVAGLALFMFADRAFVPFSLMPEARNRLLEFSFGLGGAMATGAIASFVGARRRLVWLMAAGFTLPVALAPVAATRLAPQLARDRSARDLAVAIERAAPGARVVAVGAYPLSLPFYLGRPVLLASSTARELPLAYAARRQDELRGLPSSPLRAGRWWREALEQCSESTVFVAAQGSAADTDLAADLPFIAAGGTRGRVLAYGPCAARGALADD